VAASLRRTADAAGEWPSGGGEPRAADKDLPFARRQ
jgi:hypothetical protein